MVTRIASLSDHDRQRLSEAVGAAEAHSAGEIVTIITSRSSTYADWAVIWSALAALMALAALSVAPDFYLGLYNRLAGGWVQEWHPRQIFALAALVATLKFAGMRLILLWEPLRLFLVPRAIRHVRVRDRAITCFKVGAERRTHRRTGILIYLSLAEHRAEIVADETIASQVDPRVWGDAMAAMLAELREGRMADGLIAGVERVGKVLSAHFPAAENDINELPDRLIEV